MFGIIFTGGEGPPPQMIKRILKGKRALCVAADSGLIAAENAGLRPDWIIGDMDSLTEPLRLERYPRRCVIRHNTDKDYTDTELAFSLAAEKGCDEIWIIGGGDGRIDHLFGIRSLFERGLFPRRWITDSADIRCVEAGVNSATNSALSVELEAGALVSVFPLGSGPWKVLSSGLKWPLDDLIWNRGFYGLSNVAADKNISINAQAGRFMVIIPFVPNEEKQCPL